MQLPEGRKKIRALDESFYNCEQLDYSMYLHQVKLNEILQHQRFLREIEQTPSGYFWHAKYLPPRKSVIGEVDHVIAKRERERRHQREKYRRDHHTTGRKPKEVEDRKTNPIAVGGVSAREQETH